MTSAQLSSWDRDSVAHAMDWIPVWMYLKTTANSCLLTEPSYGIRPHPQDLTDKMFAGQTEGPQQHLTTQAPWSQACSLQNSEKSDFWCLSHPVGGTLLQQPWRTNAAHKTKNNLPITEKVYKPMETLQASQKPFENSLPTFYSLLRNLQFS